jgi:hypothetical protein
MQVAITSGETASRSDQTVETDASLESTDEFMIHGDSDANDDGCQGTKKPLSADFEPSDFSVIIGRGKKIRDTIGNSRLRVLAGTYLTQYADAMDNRAKKTAIVNAIIGIVKTTCPYDGGAFIRQKEGRWYEVSDRVAREKVGYVFRDLLHDQYGSSSKSKIAKRRREQEEHEMYIQMMHGLSKAPRRQVQSTPRQDLHIEGRPPRPHQLGVTNSLLDSTSAIDNKSHHMTEKVISLPTLLGMTQFDPPLSNTGPGMTLYDKSLSNILVEATTTATMNYGQSSTSDVMPAPSSWNPYYRSIHDDGGTNEFLGESPSTNAHIPDRISSYDAFRESQGQHNQQYYHQDFTTLSDAAPSWNMSQFGSVSGPSSVTRHDQLSSFQWEFQRHEQYQQLHQHQHQQHQHQHQQQDIRPERNHMNNNYYDHTVMMDDALAPRPFPPDPEGKKLTISSVSTFDDPVHHQQHYPGSSNPEDVSIVQMESKFHFTPNIPSTVMVGYNQQQQQQHQQHQQQHNQGTMNFRGGDDVGNDDDGLDLSQLLNSV